MPRDEDQAAAELNASRAWRAAIVFAAVSVGITTAIAALMSAKGWTVNSRAWAGLVPIAMWAPAFARFIARRTVDRRSTGALLTPSRSTVTLPLRQWGTTGARVILRPLALPLIVYGAAYAIA